MHACEFLETISSRSADLVLIDPPRDMSDDDIVDVLWESWRVAKGSVLVFLQEHNVCDVDVMFRRDCKLAKSNKRDHVIWHYKSGHTGKLEERKNYVKSCTHVLRYARPIRTAHFDATTVSVPSQRQLVGDVRGDPRGRAPYNWIEAKRLHRGHADSISDADGQLPFEILKYFILPLCPPNGLVVDPMCGSGIVPIFCHSQNRDCLFNDVDENILQKAKENLELFRQ